MKKHLSRSRTCGEQANSQGYGNSLGRLFSNGDVACPNVGRPSKAVQKVAVALAIISMSGLNASEEVDRELLSQSRSQQSVGRSVQSTIYDLENLIADLESNGLIEEDMVGKMRAAREVLNSIGEENIPEATAKLRAAALSAVGRSENLARATSEVDSILLDLKAIARDVGDEQKRSAYGQILSQLLTKNQDLQDETQKWGEEQLTDPGQASETRDEVTEKQSEVESQFDALKQMLDKEISRQEDSSFKDELQEVLDALDGKGLEEFKGNLPQDVPPAQPTDIPNLPPPTPPEPTNPHPPPANDNEPGTTPPSEPKASQQPQVPAGNEKPEEPSGDRESTDTKEQPKPGQKDPPGDKPEATKPNQQGEPEPANKGEPEDKTAQKKDSPGEQPPVQKPKDASPGKKEPKAQGSDPKPDKPKDPQNLAKKPDGNKEGQSSPPEASGSKKPEKEPSAEKALEKSGKAIMANDAGSALEAQKKFEERLAKALAAMGSAMAKNLQPEGSPEGSPGMGSPPMASQPMPPQTLDPLAGMAFGSVSAGSDIGEADLDALLSGEDPDAQGGTGEGGGQTDKGDKSALAATGLPAGIPPPSQAGGKPKDGSQQKQGKPNAPNPKMPAPGKGGSPQMASMGTANPFAPPMMMPGAGAPGEGSGTSTAMFDKPHGTHFETTALKGGGGPAKGSYQKTEQSRRNLAEVARQKIQQDYQRRLPAEYRLMTAEYFELLGSMEE